MNALIAFSGLTVVLSLGVVTLEAQKGKPTQGIRVLATFDAEFVQPNGPDAGFLRGILGDVDEEGALVGPYTGTVQPDGGFLLDSTPRPIVWRSGIFNDVAAALRPSTNGSDVFMNVHNVGKVIEAFPTLAGQFGIAWTDANGKSYSLQYGDAYVDPPNYAHIQCDAPAAGVCAGWTVSSFEDSKVPTGTSPTSPLRHTGPVARLTVRLKGGTTLGTHTVPFSLKLERLQ